MIIVTIVPLRPAKPAEQDDGVYYNKKTSFVKSVAYSVSYILYPNNNNIRQS